jgi:uncharacterized protein YjlB
MGKRQTVAESFPQPAKEPEVLTQVFKDDGVFPNSQLPLLLYRDALMLPEHDAAAAFEKQFAAHGWRGSWRNGIYSYHHYHSTAHEVLGVYRGSAKVQLGGKDGAVFEICSGDVVIIPAGVAHKKIGCSADFGVVGAYPDGQRWDMNYGGSGERPQADENITRVPWPKMDPVYGVHGALLKQWGIR